MSNSSLVNYTKISPNRTILQNKINDVVVIHCVVGQCSVETLGSLFADPSRGASSNYGIGYDGRIGMYCEEKDRSWCTGGVDKNKNPIRVNGISGADIDHRAITIEVASDTFEPYKVNEKAYASLINLLADICKRNNIKKLSWKADKSLVGDFSKQNMVVHRWFAPKSCPGDYLYDLHGQIAEEVNAKLKTSTTPSASKVPTYTESTESMIYSWLKQNTEFNDAAVAGILANLEAESGFKSSNLQNSYERSLGYTDESYTYAVDTGKYKNFVRDSAGYGLIQWTYWSRKQGLLNYAKSKDTSISDYRMQLEYMIKELRAYTNVWKILTTCPNTEEGAYQCAHVYCYEFEAPASKSIMSVRRGNSAKQYYKKYQNRDTVDNSMSTPIEISFDSIKVGDILEFRGIHQYISANASNGVIAKPCRVKVMKKYIENSKHPIHARSVDENGKYTSGVYGWLNLSDLFMISTEPYLVKVTVDSLNYRSGPSTSYPVVGVIRDKGVYTILQEKNGWGQLKSKVGWISLSYTKKI